MRGKSVSMDGIPDFTPSTFYVPGERHENLPAGGFAGHTPYATMGRHRGMGTPVQTLIPDNRLPEYATGGSGMFQGADFGHGKLIALHGPRRRHMGQDDSGVPSWLSDITGGISDVASTVSDVRDAVGPQASVQASAPVAASAPSAVSRLLSPSAGGIMSKKIMGLPAIAVLAIAGAAGFFLYKKMGKKR